MKRGLAKVIPLRPDSGDTPGASVDPDVAQIIERLRETLTPKRHEASTSRRPVDTTDERPAPPPPTLEQQPGGSAYTRRKMRELIERCGR